MSFWEAFFSFFMFWIDIPVLAELLTRGLPQCCPMIPDAAAWPEVCAGSAEVWSLHFSAILNRIGVFLSTKQLLLKDYKSCPIFHSACCQMNSSWKKKKKRRMVTQLEILAQHNAFEWHIVIVDEQNVARWLINKNKVGCMRSWVWTWIFRTSNWIWHEQRSQQGNKKEFHSNASYLCCFIEVIRHSQVQQQPLLCGCKN